MKLWFGDSMIVKPGLVNEEMLKGKCEFMFCILTLTQNNLPVSDF